MRVLAFALPALMMFTACDSDTDTDTKDTTPTTGDDDDDSAAVSTSRSAQAMDWFRFDGTASHARTSWWYAPINID